MVPHPTAGDLGVILNNKRKIRFRADQAAFSLIELLVTVVIFSIGLLAVAGLQSVSKRANYEALQRTTAAHIAYGLLEDMRNNGDGVPVYLASAPLGGATRGAVPSLDCRGSAASCTAAQRAAYDLWFWENYVDGSLEQGVEGAEGGLVAPTICVTGPAGGVAGMYLVTVAWRGSAALSEPAANACGSASGNYGTDNEFRRLVQMPTFLDPRI